MKCESCDIEVAVLPLMRYDRCYCCAGCADGGPCVCSYVDDPGRLGTSRSQGPVLVRDLLDRYDSDGGDGHDRTEYPKKGSA